jgi:hypothetical protein
MFILLNYSKQAFPNAGCDIALAMELNKYFQQQPGYYRPLVQIHADPRFQEHLASQASASTNAASTRQ